YDSVERPINVTIFEAPFQEPDLRGRQAALRRPLQQVRGNIHGEYVRAALRKHFREHAGTAANFQDAHTWPQVGTARNEACAALGTHAPGGRSPPPDPLRI